MVLVPISLKESSAFKIFLIIHPPPRRYVQADPLRGQRRKPIWGYPSYFLWVVLAYLDTMNGVNTVKEVEVRKNPINLIGSSGSCVVKAVIDEF